MAITAVDNKMLVSRVIHLCAKGLLALVVFLLSTRHYFDAALLFVLGAKCLFGVSV